MDLGDLIQWQSKLWLVYKVDSDTATAFIESQNHEREILGLEVDCPVICNPVHDWPSVTLLPRKGHLVQVQKADSRIIPLAWLQDWVKLDDFQMGGALFLNPELRLEYGDRLIISQNIYGYETQFPVAIPRNFRSFSQKQVERKETEPEGNLNLFDYLRTDR